MTSKELMEQMQKNNSDQEYLDELRSNLADELKKPVEEQDYDVIDDLTQTIAMITGTDAMIARKSQNVLNQVKQRMMVQKTTVRKRHGFFTAACACAAFLIVSNIWSYSALGINAFSAAMKLLNGSVTIDLLIPPEHTARA